MGSEYHEPLAKIDEDFRPPSFARLKENVIFKRVFWSSVIAAIWILSMIHSEHVGMHEQQAKDKIALQCP